MARLSGKDGKVKVNGTDVNVRSWSVDPTNDAQDVTDTGDEGYKDVVAGLSGATGTLELNWDTAANPTSNPPNLNPGETLTNLDLYLNGSSYFRAALALITGTPIASAVDGKVTFTCNFTVKGSWTMPT